MATRSSKTKHMGVSREEADKAFAEYAQAEAKLQTINAKMEAEMMKIREKYHDQVLELEGSMDEKFDIVHQYAVEHRNDLFQDKKKVEWTHGVFGFRAGSPKLTTLEGMDWKDVLNRCQGYLPEYVRTTCEVAKSKLLADRNKPEVAEKFEMLGVRVVTEDRFFIETKK